jgi:dTDP-4-amino-4,6-dideoxygalactose transaminase
MGSLWHQFQDLGNPIVMPWARAGLSALCEVLSLKNSMVITPSTICPIVGSVFLSGAKAVLGVETDPLSGLVSDEDMASKTSRHEAGLIMPTRLYGFEGEFSKTYEQAKRKGIFCLLNDTNAVALNEGHYEGDGLCFSFGSSKAIDAGGGAVLFVKDQYLHSELVRIINTYLVMTMHDHEKDLMITHKRRALRRLGLMSPADLIDSEAQLAKRSWPRSLTKAWLVDLKSHIQNAEDDLERKREIYDHWCALFSILKSVRLPTQKPINPWRFIAHIDPLKRDKVVDGLRARSIDIGTNYPSLGSQFSQIAPLESALFFEKSVINLWLDKDQSDAQRRMIANLIAELIYD